MTNLEQEFFKVFGIEKICVRGCGEYYSERNIDIWDLCKNKNCKKYKCHLDKSIWEYPEITDRVLLELICLHNSNCKYAEDLYAPCEFEDIKEEFLKELMNKQKRADEVCYYEGENDFIKKVQSLFAEEADVENK